MDQELKQAERVFLNNLDGPIEAEKYRSMLLRYGSPSDAINQIIQVLGAQIKAILLLEIAKVQFPKMEFIGLDKKYEILDEYQGHLVSLPGRVLNEDRDSFICLLPDGVFLFAKNSCQYQITPHNKIARCQSKNAPCLWTKKEDLSLYPHWWGTVISRLSSWSENR